MRNCSWMGKGFRVNGVFVNCMECKNKDVEFSKNPCSDCWEASYHDGDIKDISFYPKDLKKFNEVKSLIAEYKDVFEELKNKLGEIDMPMSEFLEQFEEDEDGTLNVAMQFIE